MVGAALESVWAATEIDAAYAAVLRTVIQPILPTELPAQADPVSLTDLVALCCQGYGGDLRLAEHAALAWNILYTTLYLLDGVEDGDRRDGRWFRWGVGAAINISTGLLATVGALLNKLEAAGLDSEIAQTVRAEFFHALLGMTAGQHHDLTLKEPTLGQSWQIVRAKSGDLFGLACRVGAMLAGADRQRTARCGEFGQILGVLIQVGDDLDDLWSKPNQASDLMGDRWTLPVAYAMTVLPTAAQARLRNLLRAARTDPVAEAEARSQILAAGAALYLELEARRLQEQARSALVEWMPESLARDRLLRLLDRFMPLKD